MRLVATYECSFSFGGKRMALPAATSHKPSPGRRQKSSSVRTRRSSLVAIMSLILINSTPVFVTVRAIRILLEPRFVSELAFLANILYKIFSSYGEIHVKQTTPGITLLCVHSTGSWLVAGLSRHRGRPRHRRDERRGWKRGGANLELGHERKSDRRNRQPGHVHSAVPEAGDIPGHGGSARF